MKSLATGGVKAKLSLREPAWNKTEAAFARELGCRPSIVWWAYEPLKLRLADKCFYSPDFAVLFKDGSFHIYEVKGFWRDDARVKIKTAARLFPMFSFHAVTRIKNGWKQEDF